jgi:fatty acid desaturase
VALGAPALISFTAYRVMHTRHHDHLGTEDDPDDYHNYSGRRGVVWALHYVRLTAGCVLYLLAIPFLAFRQGSASERRAIVAEYAILAAVYALALAVIPFSLLAAAWLVPLLLVAVMVQVRGFTQHGITDAHDPFLASRSIEAHPVVAFLLLNENYHLEHHLFPEVPSYHLPALHRAIWDRLPRAVSGTSYLGFLGRFLRATLTLDETPIGLVEPAKAKA